MRKRRFTIKINDLGISSKMERKRRDDTADSIAATGTNAAQAPSIPNAEAAEAGM